MGKIDTETIYRLRQEGKTYKQIGAILNCHETTVYQHCNSQEYEKIENREQKTKELVRNLAPEKRTRRLVNELLEAVEHGVKTAKTDSDKLKYIDDVKQLVAMVGLSADEESEINVIEVPGFLTDKDFNQLNDCTEISTPIKPPTQNPQIPQRNDGGNKTPTPPQISNFEDGDPSPWDGFLVEGIDA